MSELLVTVAGVDRTSKLASPNVTFDLPVNARGLMNLTFGDTAGGFRPLKGEEVFFTEDGVNRFGGKIVDVDENYVGADGVNAGIEYACAVGDFMAILDRRRVLKASYVKATIGAIVADLNTNYLDSEGFTVNVDAAASTYTIEFNGVTVRDALEELVEMVGDTRAFWVDEDKVIQVRKTTSLSAPAILDVNNVGLDPPPVVDDAQGDYRNVQHITGGPDDRINITRTNAGEITARIAAEGGGSGQYEAWEHLPDVASAAAANAAGDALLQRFGTWGSGGRITLRTLVVGFRSGQQATVRLPNFGFDDTTMYVEEVTARTIGLTAIEYTVTATTADPTGGWQLRYKRAKQQHEQARPSRVPTPVRRPTYTAPRKPATFSGPAATGDFNLLLRFDEKKGIFGLMADNQVTAVSDIAWRLSFEASANITITEKKSGLGVTVTDDGTRAPVVESDGEWELNASTRSTVILGLGGPLTKGGTVMLDVWAVDVHGGGTDRLSRIMYGDTTLATNVNARNKVSFPIDLEPYFAGTPPERVRDGAQDGERGQAYKGERDGVAGYLDVQGAQRSTMPVRTEDGVSILVDTEAGAVGSSLLREVGGPALNTSFSKSADDSDDVGEGSTKKFVGSSGTGDLDDVDEGTSYKRLVAASADSSGRVIKIRRTGGGGSDVDPDDVSKKDEVQANIGGLANADLRDGGTTIIDTSARELDLGTVLDAVSVGTAPDGETANRIRSGAVRGMNAIDGSYRIAGDIEEGVTGVGDGVSSWGMSVAGDGDPVLGDSGQGGGGGTGEGGEPDPV